MRHAFIAFYIGVMGDSWSATEKGMQPRLGRMGDRIGMVRIRVPALPAASLLFVLMSLVKIPWQLAGLRFLLGFADGAVLPAVQTLLVAFSSPCVTGRVLGYNQSFLYMGNMIGPMMGSTAAVVWGFRWVFVVTAIMVAFNTLQLVLSVLRVAVGRTVWPCCLKYGFI